MCRAVAVGRGLLMLWPPSTTGIRFFSHKAKGHALGKACPIFSCQLLAYLAIKAYPLTNACCRGLLHSGLTQEPRRLLRRRRVDVEPGAPLKSRCLGQL